MFLQASAILLTGGSASVHAGSRPPGSRHPPPQEQTPTPLGTDPPEADTPPGADTHPREADSSIRSTSGRYASYWNAFLSYNVN